MSVSRWGVARSTLRTSGAETLFHQNIGGAHRIFHAWIATQHDTSQTLLTPRQRLPSALPSRSEVLTAAPETLREWPSWPHWPVCYS